MVFVVLLAGVASVLVVSAFLSSLRGASTALATGCLTSSATWQNQAVASQTGSFEMTFDATPNANLMGGLTGLSQNVAASYTDLAVIVGFETSGYIDARNGSVYQALTSVPYSAGNTYHFRLDINVPSHTYSIYVTPPGQTEKTIGTNFAFRTEQASVTSLNYWNLWESGAGTHTVCNVALSPLTIKYTLTVSKSGTGTGTISSSPAGISCGTTCSASYASGTIVALTTAPALGSIFTGWSGACTGTTCSVKMSAAKSVTATFTLASYTITITNAGTGSGTLSWTPPGIVCSTTCSGTYPAGTVVTLTASPASGSTLSGWSGACTGTGSCVVTMSANKSVTATFTLSTYTLSVTKSGTGTGTISSSPAGISCGTTCSASYSSGTVVTLTASPAAGSSFAGWSGACTGTGSCVVTMSANKSVTATFNTGINYYISPTGKDTNPCTQASPCLTINSVDARLGGSLPLGSSGTIVHVAAGSYNSWTHITHGGTGETARVRYISDTKGAAKIHVTGCNPNSNGYCTGPNYYGVQIDANYIDFVGFDVTNDGYIGIAMGQTAGGLHVRILNNTIHDIIAPYVCNGTFTSGSEAIGNTWPTYPSTNPPDSYTVADGNYIYNIAVTIGRTGGGCGHGIYYTTGHNIATNNLIVNISGQGLTSYHCATNLTFANNTLVKIGEQGVILSYNSAQCSRGNNNSVVMNNIVSTAGSWGINSCSGTPCANNKVTNNIIYLTKGCALGYSANPGFCLNNLTTNPLFVNNTQTSAGDYHLQSGSPAKDSGVASAVAGTNTAAAPKIDFAGGSRPVNTFYDRGVYEFNAPGRTYPWQ